MRGIFITNSRAYRLINAMNVKDANRFVIIGYDMLEPNIQFLKESKINFIINQNAINQGYYGIMAFINHFVLKEPIEKKQYLPLDIIIKENVDFYILNSTLNI
jgi:LacI family transcriptional regulator